MAKKITTEFIDSTVNKVKISSDVKCNSANYGTNGSRVVKYVVMHYTSNKKDTAKANANYFNEPGRRASAHFFVDDEQICQSVALKDTAWHCGAQTYYHGSCRNANSIGIEMCCTADNYKISEKTKENAAHLCARMCKRIGVSPDEVDTYVLRHYDVTHKECPAQMVKNKEEWKQFKNDVRDLLEKIYRKDRIGG